MDEGTTAKKSGESTICAEIADRDFFSRLRQATFDRLNDCQPSYRISSADHLPF